MFAQFQSRCLLAAAMGGLTATVAFGGGACTPDAGSCQVPNGTVGCDDAACCEAVCAFDPFCCETEWDGICVDGAAAACKITNSTQGAVFSSLQAALEAANSGDELTIGPITLLEDNIQFPNGLDVTITGAGMDQTIIDGGGGADDTPVLSLLGSGQTDSTVISNLTIQNGVNLSAAAGVLVQGASPRFSKESQAFGWPR